MFSRLSRIIVDTITRLTQAVACFHTQQELWSAKIKIHTSGLFTHLYKPETSIWVNHFSLGGWKPLTVFFCFSRSREKQEPSTFWDFCSEALHWVYNSYNHAPAQGPHMWPSQGLRVPDSLAQLQVLQNSGSQMFMSRVKFLSALLRWISNDNLVTKSK